MRMLWLTPELFGPNNSDVIETEAENMNPELRPIKPVPACNAILLPDAESKMKAIGVGTSAMASHPVLAKRTFLHGYKIKSIYEGCFSLISTTDFVGNFRLCWEL